MEKAGHLSPSGAAAHSHLAGLRKTQIPVFISHGLGEKVSEQVTCVTDRGLHPSRAKSLTSGHQDWFALVLILY